MIYTYKGTMMYFFLMWYTKKLGIFYTKLAHQVKDIDSRKKKKKRVEDIKRVTINSIFRKVPYHVMKAICKFQSFIFYFYIYDRLTLGKLSIRSLFYTPYFNLVPNLSVLCQFSPYRYLLD